jgi:Fe-S oxidoreductase
MMLDRNMKHIYFNPSCTLELYRPQYGIEIYRYLQSIFPYIKIHDVCCRKPPRLPEGSVIVNVCTGCDMRWRTLYEGVDTISFYEILDTYGLFPYPDYQNSVMTIHDSCPVKSNPHLYDVVRHLLDRMNIKIIESDFCREKSLCCGNPLLREGKEEAGRAMLRKSAESLPVDDVLVYCISCMKVLAQAGKHTHLLLDLLMGNPSDPGEGKMGKAWYLSLKEYQKKH